MMNKRMSILSAVPMALMAVLAFNSPAGAAGTGSVSGTTTQGKRLASTNWQVIPYDKGGCAYYPLDVRAVLEAERKNLQIHRADGSVVDFTDATPEEQVALFNKLQREYSPTLGAIKDVGRFIIELPFIDYLTTRQIDVLRAMADNIQSATKAGVVFKKENGAFTAVLTETSPDRMMFTQYSSKKDENSSPSITSNSPVTINKDAPDRQEKLLDPKKPIPEKLSEGLK